MFDLVIAVTFWNCIYAGSLALTQKYFTLPQKREGGKYVPLEESKQRMTESNIVSLYYALVCILLELVIINSHGVSVHRKCFWLERFFFCHSLGFFIHDIIAKVRHGILNTFVVFHHVFGGLFCMYCLANDYVCSISALGTFLFEVTHPLLVLRGILEFVHYPQTSKLYLYNLWTFWLLFMVCRGFSFYFLYLWIINVNVSIYLTLFSAPNLALTCIWMMRMVWKLWKTLPLWYQSPEEIENSTWRIYVRETIEKYTRQKPHSYLIEVTIYMTVLVSPITYAYYLRQWSTL